MDVDRFCHFAQSELDDNVMPFWLNYADNCGGERMVGAIDFLGKPDDKTSISTILLFRVLWSLCAYYRKGSSRKRLDAEGNSSIKAGTKKIDTEPYLKAAKNVHHFLFEYCIDSTTGFFYEEVRCNHKLSSIELGRKDAFLPCSDTCFKTLTQSYAIYALAEFFGATAVQKDLDQVLALVGRLELAAKKNTHQFYSDVVLIERDVCDGRPLNVQETRFNLNNIDTRCQMHLVEAYTCLLRVHFDKHLQSLLLSLLDAFTTHVYRHTQDYFPLCIDASGQIKDKQISFGHNMEAAWLLYDAALVVKSRTLQSDLAQKMLSVVDATLDLAQNEFGAFWDWKYLDGSYEKSMTWWVQAESLNALMTCYIYTKNEKYLQLTIKLWDFIQVRFHDTLQGEWYTRLNEQANVDQSAEKVGPWRGPYHIVRSCLKLSELSNRSDFVRSRKII